MDEQAFQEWYRTNVTSRGLNPNPDDPRHYYDWRAAYKSGASPDKSGHWPSTFKLDGHPRLIIEGVNTKTGKPVSKLQDKAKNYIPIVKRAVQGSSVPANLLLGLLAQESGFNPNAVSGSGAQGIAQFMPTTAKDYGIDPRDPNQAIPAAVKYLDRAYKQFGNWDSALAAYNAGPGAVKKYGGVPPFKETQKYVPAVKQLASMFGDTSMLQDPNAMKQVAGAAYPAQQQPTQQPGLMEVLAQYQGMQPKRSALDSIVGTLAALGGTAANTIGAIKGNPATGNAALAAGIGLLGKPQQPGELNDVQSLAAQEYFRDKTEAAKQNDPLYQANLKKANQDIANTRTPEEMAKIQANAAGDRELAKGAAIDKRVEELTEKAAAAYQSGNMGNAKIFRSQIKKLTGATAGFDDPTTQRIIKDDLSSLEMMKELQFNVVQIRKALDTIPTGKLSGRFERWKSNIVGNPALAEMDAIKAFAFSNTARSIAAEKGPLSNFDVDRVQRAFEDETMTEAERKAAFSNFIEKMQRVRSTKLQKIEAVAGEPIPESYKKFLMPEEKKAEPGSLDDLVGQFGGKVKIRKK